MKTVIDRLILEKTSGEQRSASGLITLSLNQLRGKVIAAGPEVEGITVGDEVLYRDGVDLSVDGKQVVVVSMMDVLVVIPAGTPGSVLSVVK